MARISKEERLRQEGMAQAYRIAQTRGIDGLKKEIEIFLLVKHVYLSLNKL